MTNETHGISIGLERSGANFMLTMKAVGKLTHEDYKKITPLLDSALSCVNDPHVNVLFDATEFEGWELRAAWDDFKLGLKYSNSFDKIALFGNKRWQELSAKIGTWFVPGEVKYFNEKSAAIEWLTS